MPRDEQPMAPLGSVFEQALPKTVWEQIQAYRSGAMDDPSAPTRSSWDEPPRSSSSSNDSQIWSDPSPVEPRCSRCFGVGLVVDRTLYPDHPQYGKTVDCPDCGLAQERRLNRLFGSGDEQLVHYADLTWATYPSHPLTEPLVKKVMAWAVAPSTPGLLLLGEWGVGKTSMAVCALRQRMERDHCDALFIKAPVLLARLRQTYDASSGITEADVMGAAQRTKLLLLDDLGAEQGKDGADGWAAAKFYELIDYRHERHRATIYTSNLTVLELGSQRRLGPRIAWRIHEMSTLVEWPKGSPNLRLNAKEVRSDG